MENVHCVLLLEKFTTETLKLVTQQQQQPRATSAVSVDNDDVIVKYHQHTHGIRTQLAPIQDARCLNTSRTTQCQYNDTRIRRTLLRYLNSQSM